MGEDLNQDDLGVMNILWKHGELKPAEIQEKLATPVKNAALRWQLRTLMEKGHVTRRKEGKAFYYQATTTQRNALKKFAGRLINVFGGGSAVALIGRMIDLNMMSAEEVAQLRKFASVQGQGPAKGDEETAQETAKKRRGK